MDKPILKLFREFYLQKISAAYLGVHTKAWTLNETGGCPFALVSTNPLGSRK
jgi:hypothetical protein